MGEFRKPLPSPNDPNCVEDTIQIEIDAGKPYDEAVAIAMDHCNRSEQRFMKSNNSRKEDVDEPVVFKTGEQSEDDPFLFVMSTDSRDRDGDIVEQDFNLSKFRKNPIALYQHRHMDPIGTWRTVRIEQNGNKKRTTGRLNLAEPGTSQQIDVIRSLIEQRILRAVSIGFMPKEYEEIEENKPYEGLRLSKNELFEASIVSVPANEEALSLAKSLSPEQRKGLFTESGEQQERPLCAAAQLGIQKSRDSDTIRNHNSGTKKMALADKIEAQQKTLAELRLQLEKLVEGIDGDISEETQHEMDELNGRIGIAEISLEKMLEAERSLALKSFESGGAPTSSKHTGGAPVPKIVMQSNRQKGKLVMASLAAHIKAFCNSSMTMDSIIATEYRDFKAELEIMTKQNIADTTTPGWAAELVQQEWRGFWELVRDQAVYPRVPGERMSFGTAGVINMPVQQGRGQLAGSFVGELQPLPVRDGMVGTVDMTPKEAGVISVFSKKIGRHSTPQIEGMIRNQILADTAEQIDALYLDDQPRTAVRPAGLRDPVSTGAANIVAATGGTVQDVNSDLTGMITRHLDARADIGGIIILHPVKALYLSQLQDAASGSFTFRDEIAAGNLLGYPLVQNSRNVPSDFMYLVGGGSFAFAEAMAPMIDVSDVPTVVMGDPAEHIINGGIATTQDTRSLWQIEAIGVKMMLGLDWLQVRPDTTQVLTGLDTHWT